MRSIIVPKTRAPGPVQETLPCLRLCFICLSCFCSVCLCASPLSHCLFESLSLPLSPSLLPYPHLSLSLPITPSLPLSFSPCFSVSPSVSPCLCVSPPSLPFFLPLSPALREEHRQHKKGPTHLSPARDPPKPPGSLCFHRVALPAPQLWATRLLPGLPTCLCLRSLFPEFPLPSPRPSTSSVCFLFLLMSSRNSSRNAAEEKDIE